MDGFWIQVNNRIKQSTIQYLWSQAEILSVTESKLVLLFDPNSAYLRTKVVYTKLEPVEIFE